MFLFLWGCKETPMDQAVVNKNDGALEKAIEEVNSGDISKEQKDTPKEYKERFQTHSNDVTITVDAKVQKVEGPLPIVRVKPHEILADEVKVWTDVLFEGAKAYEPDTVMTKSEIEEEIVMYKGLSTPENLKENTNTDEEAQELAEVYKQRIADLEAAYKTAPETEEKKLCEWKFYSYNHYNDSPTSEKTDDSMSLEKTFQLQAYTDELNGYGANVEATNRNEEDYKMHNLWFYYLEEEKMSEEMAYLEFSEENAVDLAERTREQLQLKDWSINEIVDNSMEDNSSYTILYTPVIEGVETISSLGDINVKSEDIYAANYYYTSLEIRIYNGLVQFVGLTSPIDAEEVVNPNVKTMGFEQICERFQTQARIQYSRDSLFGSESSGSQLQDAEIEIKVNEIKQGLFRIKEKNSENTFLFVPVWSFNGRFKINDEDASMKDMPLVMINGIDGSIINTELGY